MILLFWLLHSSNYWSMGFLKANSKDFVYCKIMSGRLGIPEFHNVTRWNCPETWNWQSGRAQRELLVPKSSLLHLVKYKGLLHHIHIASDFCHLKSRGRGSCCCRLLHIAVWTTCCLPLISLWSTVLPRYRMAQGAGWCSALIVELQWLHLYSKTKESSQEEPKKSESSQHLIKSSALNMLNCLSVWVGLSLLSLRSFFNLNIIRVFLHQIFSLMNMP